MVILPFWDQHCGHSSDNSVRVTIWILDVGVTVGRKVEASLPTCPRTPSDEQPYSWQGLGRVAAAEKRRCRQFRSCLSLRIGEPHGQSPAAASADQKAAEERHSCLGKERPNAGREWQTAGLGRNRQNTSRERPDAGRERQTVELGDEKRDASRERRNTGRHTRVAEPSKNSEAGHRVRSPSADQRSLAGKPTSLGLRSQSLPEGPGGEKIILTVPSEDQAAPESTGTMVGKGSKRW